MYCLVLHVDCRLLVGVLRVVCRFVLLFAGSCVCLLLVGCGSLFDVRCCLLIVKSVVVCRLLSVAYCLLFAV